MTGGKVEWLLLMCYTWPNGQLSRPHVFLLLDAACSLGLAFDFISQRDVFSHFITELVGGATYL